MKLRILIPFIITLLPWQIYSQTADVWIAQGRSYLSAHNLDDANASFNQAASISPTNETANVFYAITRLLVLPDQPAGSNFLTRIGLPVAGRNLYNWTATPPADTNGLALAPVGVDAADFTAQLRTNFLLAVAGAVTNLSVITDTNFSLDLSSAETVGDGVTVDYGDLKLIQAGLYAAEYFIYTLNAQNLDAQLTSLRSLYLNGAFTAGAVLADYPGLFTFATTNNLPAARAAFLNAVNAYLDASAFIRSRPAGEIRLFNYNPEMSHTEGNFRLVLQDLKNSLLVGPQILSLYPDYYVDLSPQFDGRTTLRNLLPQFDGNAVALGSLPDPTFSGMIYGLAQADEESFLGNYLTMLPVGNPPELLSDNTVQLSFTTLTSHYYVLETSTDLSDWQMQTNFTAVDASSTLVDSRSPGVTSRFYRLRDDTGFMTFAGTVIDQSSYYPIAGAEIYSDWDGTSTYTDANGQFYLKTTLPASVHEDELTISEGDHTPVTTYFVGNGIVSGLVIYLGYPPSGIIITSQGKPGSF